MKSAEVDGGKYGPLLVSRSNGSVLIVVKNTGFSVIAEAKEDRTVDANRALFSSEIWKKINDVLPRIEGEIKPRRVWDEMRGK